MSSLSFNFLVWTSITLLCKLSHWSNAGVDLTAGPGGHMVLGAAATYPPDLPPLSGALPRTRQAACDFRRLSEAFVWSSQVWPSPVLALGSAWARTATGLLITHNLDLCSRLQALANTGFNLTVLSISENTKNSLMDDKAPHTLMRIPVSW